LVEDEGLCGGRLVVEYRREEFAGRLGAEHEYDGRQSVAVGSAGVDDGGLQHAFDGPHGARIEDVAVAMTIIDKELFGACPGGERGVFELDGGSSFAGLPGIRNVYGPACSARDSADGVESASASRYEGGGDAPVAKKFRDAVDGEAFADTAGVEFHRLMIGEGDGSGLWVESDIFPADFIAHGVELGLRRDAPLMEEEAPGAKKRADGDIECAVGDAAPIEGSFEEAEAFGIRDDGNRAGLTAYAGEFAGWAVVAEESFEAIDFLEGQIHVLLRCGLVGDVEVDGKDGAHGGMGLMEALQRGLCA